MRIFLGRIENEDHDTGVHTIVVMDEKEVEEYGECESAQDYYDFAMSHTKGHFTDNDIYYYASKSELLDGKIMTGDVVFVDLEEMILL